MSELKSGRGELVSSATSSVNLRSINTQQRTHHDGRRAEKRCIPQPCSEPGRQSLIPAWVGNCRNKKKKSVRIRKMFCSMKEINLEMKKRKDLSERAEGGGDLG